MNVQLRRAESVAEFLPDAAGADRLPASAVVSIRGLRKSFGEQEVLRGIDLQIHAGEFIAVVGRTQQSLVVDDFLRLLRHRGKRGQCGRGGE